MEKNPLKTNFTVTGFALLALTAGTALAQDATQSQGMNFSETTWSTDGTYVWTRPSHVRYVLVRACGGGGGGGGGYSIGSRPLPATEGGTAAGGGGGAGAAVTTILLGPLTADSYQIVIGRGGSGGRSKVATRSSADPTGNGGDSGTPTAFSGGNLAFETPGGNGGTAGKAQSRMSAESTMYEFFVSGGGDSGGVFPGGGTAQNGARGLLGAGGAGNTTGFSGGGAGSLGPGGAGGTADDSGAGGGTCAGGGGAGFPRSSATNSAGGRGGAGSLTLVSVASPAD